MGLPVVRVDDKLTCGDVLNEGSPDVFANNIPVGRLFQDKNKGNGDCGEPTEADHPLQFTVFVNNKPIMPSHISGIPAGTRSRGIYVDGSSDVFVEIPSGSLALVEIPDDLASHLNVNKQDFTNAGIPMTFGHLIEHWDDSFSDESDAQIPTVQQYNTTVPREPLMTTSDAPPELTPKQARVYPAYQPPVQMTGDYEKDKNISEGVVKTTKNTPPGTADEDAGGITTTQIRQDLDETPEPPQTTTNTSVIAGDYSDIDGHSGAWSSDFRLSPNFVLGQFAMGKGQEPRCGKYPIVANVGVSDKEIVKNLRALCINVLEPLKSKFPSVLVNSGFRRASGGSQHNRGMAADMYVPNIQQDADALYEGAVWIRDNLNYDQFIFETAGRNVWYHLSFKRPENGGNRPKNAPNAVMTTTTGGPPYTLRLFKIPR